jgi:hypothetical protein
MIIADFRVQFPEFRGVSDATVTAYLQAANLEIDQVVWGAMGPGGLANATKADQGHGYLTAHKLASSPFGQAAKMVAKDGSTTYEANYKKLVRQVASGFRVTS